MLSDNRNNLWSAFSKYIYSYASKREDFILLATEGAMRSSLIEKLPQNKIYSPVLDDRNIIMAAAGLALAGKRPWVISESADILISNYGDIRNVLASSGLPVNIAVANAGFPHPTEGSRHNILEDVALMRTVANMVVLVPSNETFFDEKNSVLCSYNGPVYIRLSTEEQPSDSGINAGDAHHGGSRILSVGDDVTICACGNMVEVALKASKILKERGINAEIIDCYRINPFSDKFLIASVRKTGCCVVVEEHRIEGGLFSAVTMSLSQTYPVPVRCVAVNGKIDASESAPEVKEYYGLNWKAVVDAATQVYTLRRR